MYEYLYIYIYIYIYLCTPLRVSQRQKSKIYFIYALETLNKYLSHGATKKYDIHTHCALKKSLFLIEKNA